jgi:hypothetical protein
MFCWPMEHSVLVYWYGHRAGWQTQNDLSRTPVTTRLKSRMCINLVNFVNWRHSFPLAAYNITLAMQAYISHGLWLHIERLGG